MHDATLELVRASAEAAEQQLDAARRLDAQALQAATRRRQDLLFQLGLVDPATVETGRAELIEALDRLRRLDARLSAVLRAGLEVLESVAPQGPPVVYAWNGRLRGGRS